MLDFSLIKYLLKLLNKHIRHVFYLQLKQSSDILFIFSKQSNFL